MAKVIGIVAQKGGVGKTTTTLNLAYGLASRGKKTLIVDVDTQGNITSWIMREKNCSMVDVLEEKITPKEAVHKTDYENLFIIPGADDMQDFAESQKLDAHMFKKYIGEIKDEYDYIVYDTPPALGIVTVGTLVAVDEIISPVKAEWASLEGVIKLMSTCKVVQEETNQDLKFAGLALTMYRTGTNLAKRVEETLDEKFGSVFVIKIRQNVEVAEAPSKRQPIQVYAPSSIGAEDYNQLVDAVMGKAEVNREKEAVNG